MNKNDLRFIKTEENIVASFLKILEKEDFSVITITEICQLARCSRNTFYLHYQTKDELMNNIVNEVLLHLSDELDNRVTNIGQIDFQVTDLYIKGIIESVKRDLNTLKILVLKDLGQFRNQYADTINETFIKNAGKISGKSDTEEYYLITAYLSHAITGFIFYWIQSSNLTLEEAEVVLLKQHSAAIEASLYFLKN